MVLYSLALLLALVLSAPVWGVRMLRQERYRAGMRERLGAVPARLLAWTGSRPVVWVHAVSVGETLAAERLLRELSSALPGHAVVLSTTTPHGHALAQERFGPDRTFLYPVDFAFAVRSYLRALRPSLVVLLESELWPRMLYECDRRGIPVAVVNARVSDRSLPRYRALRALWQPLLKKISLLLAQSAADADRWRQIGVPADRVRDAGNLKYDIGSEGDTPVARLIRSHLPAADTRVIVAGSTHPGEHEEVLAAYAAAISTAATADGPVRSLLLLAPRHVQESAAVAEAAGAKGLPWTLLSTWRQSPRPLLDREVLVVDTVGELAGLYSVATCAFIGGSLVNRGGHNPLEAAQFAVPVATGPHFQNFRTVLDGMRARGGITVVTDSTMLSDWFRDFLNPDEPLDRSGEAAKAFYESQRGATGRTVAALTELLRETETARAAREEPGP